MLLKVSDSTPDFSLPDQDNKVHKLSDYLGRWVLIYFYPKDDTPGCTTEACGFRDNLPDFDQLGVQVFGISVDTVKKHKRFADKYNLNFTLLSDAEKKTVEDYGVWAKKKFMGREYMGILRTSFLINPQGQIAKIYENVKPAEHVLSVKEDLKLLI